VSSRVLAWFGFSLALALAWSFAHFYWTLGPWYMQGQLLLLALTVIAGVSVITLSSMRKRTTVPIVLGGLVVANFGLLEVGAMVAIWHFGGGFAP
jgi:FtsH-binding integral membrane protein